jgi:hypothetical protein
MACSFAINSYPRTGQEGRREGGMVEREKKEKGLAPGGGEKVKKRRRRRERERERRRGRGMNDRASEGESDRVGV